MATRYSQRPDAFGRPRSGWYLFALAALCLLLLAPNMADARKLRITVGGADFQPYPIAVPAVLAEGATSTLAGEVTRLLRTDVDLARHFLLVPPNTYLAAATEPLLAPKLSAWQDVGASGLIRGQLVPHGSSRQLTLVFFDVHGGKQALRRTCSIEGEQPGACVHSFLDELVTLLTGEPGIFSTRLAFVRREGRSKNIWTCDIDGGACQASVTAGPLSLLPAWDPSGRFLLYTSYLSGRALLYRRLASGGPAEAISNKRGLNMGAAVSPDGKRVALTLSIDGQAEIYSMDWHGGGLKRLTHGWGQDVSPCWSPDSSQIAFVSSRTGSPHLYTMQADGSGQKRLTFQGNYNQEPDWSPRADGKIVFTARDEFLRYDLFAVNPRTGLINRLTQDAGDNDSPSFAPDGRHIVFASSRGLGRKKALFIMDEEGHKVRRIDANMVDIETPAWGPRRPTPSGS